MVYDITVVLMGPSGMFEMFLVRDLYVLNYFVYITLVQLSPLHSTLKIAKRKKSGGRLWHYYTCPTHHICISVDIPYTPYYTYPTYILVPIPIIVDCDSTNLNSINKHASEQGKSLIFFAWWQEFPQKDATDALIITTTNAPIFFGGEVSQPRVFQKKCPRRLCGVNCFVCCENWFVVSWHTYMGIYTRTQTHAHAQNICVYIHMFVHVHVHIHLLIHVYTQTHTQTHARTHSYMHA